MSRKTRKQKLAAEQRHTEQLTIQATPSGSLTPQSYSYISANQKPATTQLKTAASESNIVISDIKRIIVLTLLAICAQLVLWYFWNRR